jgi:hypothetical protein
MRITAEQLQAFKRLDKANQMDTGDIDEDSRKTGEFEYDYDLARAIASSPRIQVGLLLPKTLTPDESVCLNLLKSLEREFHFSTLQDVDIEPPSNGNLGLFAHSTWGDMDPVHEALIGGIEQITKISVDRTSVLLRG